MFPVVLTFRPRCPHAACRSTLVRLLEGMPAWHGGVGHVYVGEATDDRIDAVLFLRVAEQATVGRECRSAVRALRDRSAVTFEVDQVPEATD